jgi:hypothetical protein
MARNYSNITVETTLVSSIGPSDTIIDVADDTGFPAQFPFSLILDFQASTVEVVNVTGKAGGSYVVERGQDGTASQAHSAGAVVVHGVTARDLKEPQDHIEASTNVHGIGATAAVVGTDTAQTLTNKIVENHARVQFDFGGGYSLVAQPTIYVGADAPDSPLDGDIWFEVI